MHAQPFLRVSTAGLCALLIASSAAAQDCLLGPVTLPGLAGAPEWFDMNGDGFFRAELHDPRWSGAPFQLLTALPSGGLTSWAEDAAVRVVADGKLLYVSLQAQVDDNGPNLQDAAYFAFNQGSSNGGYAVEILPIAGAAVTVPATYPQDPQLPTRLDPPAPAPDPGAVRWWSTTDANPAVGDPNWGVSQNAVPSWLKYIGRWDRPSGSPRWAITFVLDLSPTGLNISGPMKMFWGAKMHNSIGTDVILGNVTPKVAADTDKISDTIIPFRSSQWAAVTEPGTACTSGVTLDRSDVGVWTGTAGSASPGTLTNQICTGASCGGTGENTFRVTARKADNSGGIAAWDLRARVRIADWGSTIADRNLGPWKDVTLPAGTAVFSADAPPAVGSPFTAANGWYWVGAPADAGDPSTSNITIDFHCNKGADAYCPKLTDPTATHQCVLVELGERDASKFKFRNTAVYRNMDYQGLSTSSVPATISIQGLKALTGQAKDRDVYLYIETRNLPPHGREPLWLNAKDLALARQIAETPFQVPTKPGVRVDNPLGKIAGVKAQAKAPAKPAAAKAAVAPAAAVDVPSPAARLAQSTQKFANGLRVSSAFTMDRNQLLDAVWPTYRIRPYIDTGKTVVTRGAAHRLLEPMVPFGYRLDHDGALYGFSHALEGLGANLVFVAPNWYKVVIPSEAAIHVQTTITAQEKPLSPENCPTCPSCPTPVEHGHCNCRFVGADEHGLPLTLGALAALGMAAVVRRRRRK